jgi:DNA-damage-inducible protein J
VAKTASISVKVEPKLKEEVDSIFKTLGISASEAINLFYSKVKALKRLPFESKTPNKETIQAFKDSDEGKNLVKTRNLDDLFNQLGL